MIKPYYQDEWTTIYHGDCREILPQLGPAETVITDPVWPNGKADLIGSEDPVGLFQEMIAALPEADRFVVQLGCDTDPRFLSVIPQAWLFLRVIWLRYANPSYKGRLLLSSDVAYAFGKWPRSIAGRRVIGGEHTSTRPDKMFIRHVDRHKKATSTGIRQLPHPTARRYEHVRFLISQFSEQRVLDPFMGSGTTAVAAKNLNRKFVGIEIKEEYCELAVKRLSQSVMDLTT